jgi:hypothetical protein
MADVRDILNRLHIPYVERGPNVKRGNVNIRCPWCSDDPSHHMGIVPESGWYGCWRDRSHRGKFFPRLLAAAASISIEYAKSIASEYFSEWAQDDAFSNAVKAMSDAPTDERVKAKRKPNDKTLSRELRNLQIISDKDPLCRRHRRYLEARGFPEASSVARRYSLMYAVGGEWKDRVVIPYYVSGKLVTLTGRSIYEATELRYKALPENRSILTTKQCLYNHDDAVKRDGVLFVVEGPFDVIKFDFFIPSKAHCGVVGVSSVAIEDDQLEPLLNLCERFDRVVVMADQSELKQSMDMQAQLGRKAVVFDWGLAMSKKDPGNFTKQIVRDVCRHYGACK